MKTARHDLFRIALYYCYIPIHEEGVHDHIAFHEELCGRLDLCGRIRIAAEGINGVISGSNSSLICYEQELKESLTKMMSSRSDGTSWELDMKYCHLRTDLSIESQLFTSISIRPTDQVVSLFDLAKQSSIDCDRVLRSKNGGSNDRRQPESTTISSIYKRSLEQASHGKHPAPHLSPEEWNAKLFTLTGDDKNDVILLDCRNVYESNVGYFRYPNSTTLLTNTRQYSELPQVFIDHIDRLAKCSHIFSFCTGGVRCERATQFLDQLLEERNEAYSSGLKSKPQIYQLHGGIQKYLEVASASNTLVNQFEGKNFVFDLRRTDPVHGDSIMGSCLVCEEAHDDYDNGHAPAEGCASRCFLCRILVLVCPRCRPTVSCWGDEHSEDRPFLSCGGLGDKCLKTVPVREIQN
jgi:predicted sulfurtransferase